jgi:large subunit ribosomal protein L10
MVRTRSQKNQLVDEIRAVFDGAGSLFLVSLSGLSSNDVNHLRAALRRRGARIRVIKNRLGRRAAAGQPAEQLERWMRGPTALVYHPSDPVGMAKELVDFAKDHPQLELRAGLLERAQVVAGSDARAVANLPSLEQARGMLLGVINAPATQLLRVINAAAGQLVRVVDARARKEGGDEVEATSGPTGGDAPGSE